MGWAEEVTIQGFIKQGKRCKGGSRGARRGDGDDFGVPRGHGANSVQERLSDEIRRFDQETLRQLEFYFIAAFTSK